ncbi:MAG: hypothetical protein ACYCO3_14370 [Mycobacteriales bacterium]
MVGEHCSYRMVAAFTEVVIHQSHVPEPMRSAEARAGFLTSLDKLDEHHLIRRERS